MILFTGFQTARRALNGDVAPIYSTPATGELPKRCHIHHFLHNILFGDWKMRLHRRFSQVSYDRFTYFLYDFVNGRHTKAKQFRNGV